MFRIFTLNRNRSFPVFDRSALKLAAALLQNDLDDRMDGLRDVLETDPLLANWAIQVAADQGIQLTTLPSACRWMSEHFVELFGRESFKSSDRESKSSLQAWRSVVSTSISAARHARLIARRNQASNNAYWYALLCCCSQQMDTLADLNGRSPLHGVRWSVPKWLHELQLRVTQATEWHDAAYAAGQAIQLTSSTDRRWLSDDEADELFRPDPVASQLVPALFDKLCRLDRLETEFSAALHREKMAAMQQLAYGASHEINNPLANISTRAQSLMHNEQDADRRRKLLAINQQAFRAYEMIADLMLFAKPPKLQNHTVHLNQLVGQIRDELESSESSVSCRISCGDDSIAIQGDETQLGVAIKAICQNGIDAMGGGGELLLDLSVSDGQNVSISVKDSGPGLTEHSRRHLFDPFYSGREAGRGMGFGLSKAWRIVEQHHGRIAVSSIPEHGSCFTITLPLTSTDAHI